MGEVIDIDRLADEVRRGSRAGLARAITLIESKRRDHAAAAQALLQALLAHTGTARRIGITGPPGVGKSSLIDSFGSLLTGLGHKVAVLAGELLDRLAREGRQALRIGLSGTPGVGKSTFIEAFGMMLTGQGLRVAVLAVDPSSTRSGGSILGDKTRMERLAREPGAFIRPSPSQTHLGGVARRSREVVALCEAAGFDVVIVETVGTGQSETAVAGMVDIFIAVMAPGAGDELQGIKKGIVEMADVICVNKADGDMADKARRAAADYTSALNILAPASANWRTRVLTASALTGAGLAKLWQTVVDHREALEAAGELRAKRQEQLVDWLHALLEERIMQAFRENVALAEELGRLEAQVRAGKTTPVLAVERLMAQAGKSAG